MVLVRGERVPAGAGPIEQDLIVLEVGGLEEDVNTVRESPDGHADLRERMLLDHGERGRYRGHQRRICRRVYVGLDRFFHNSVEDQLFP